VFPLFSYYRHSPLLYFTHEKVPYYNYFLLILFYHHQSTGFVKDSLALVDFFNYMNGPNWNAGIENSSWDLTTPVASWRGVTVENGRVVKLGSWGQQYVYGHIPESFGNLDSLLVFGIFDNYVYSLPSNFIGLSRLTRLQLRASCWGFTQGSPSLAHKFTSN
jgi:hypothetical protein